SFQFTNFIGEKLFLNFHQQLEYIQRTFAVHNKQVVRFSLAHFKQYAFNLRWEHIHAANDEHIVGEAGAFLHAYKRSATGTLLIIQTWEVTGSVTQYGNAFLGYC